MDEDIVINVEFEGANLPISNAGNVQVVPANLAWEDFELMLKVFSDQEAICVQYIDDEKDVVTICSEEELAEAFKVAKQCNNTLNIRVLCFPGSAGLIDQISQPPAAVTTTSTTDMDQSPPPVEPSAPLPTTTPQAVAAAIATMMEEDTPVAQAEMSSKPKEIKKFFLKNEASGLVLDIANWNKGPGAAVIPWGQKNPSRESADNQQWYEHEGTIRSVWSGACLTAEGTSPLKASPYVEGLEIQKLQLVDGRIQLSGNPGLVLEQNNLKNVVLQERKEKYPKQRWTKLFSYKSSRDGPPVKRERARGYYARLAQQVSNDGTQKSTASCTVNAGTAPDRDQSPAWFTKEMDKMKQELSDEVSARVAQLTVKQVLQGLEGAVVSSISVPNTASPTPQPSRTHSMDSRVRYSHDGIICDHCDGAIVGIRYKCGNCEDFDLCERCEGVEGVHDGTHVFLALRIPAPGAGRRHNGKMVPLLKQNIYTSTGPEKVKRSSSAMDEADSSSSNSDKEAVVPRHINKQAKELEKLKVKEEKLKKKEEKLKRKEEKIEQKRKKTEEKLKRSLDSEERPRKKERLDLPQFKMSMRMSAQFLHDESFPDGTHVQPGSKLVKKWCMQNVGTHAWTSDTKLKMMWGNMTSADQVHVCNVPQLQVGETGTVSVELSAPQEPGSYQSHWRLVHKGVRFGHRIWCAIAVDPQEVLEVPSSTTSMEQEVEEDGPVEEAAPAEDEEQVVAASVAALQLSTPAEKGTTQVIDSDLLTAQDILSFEMLDIGERSGPKMSQTATPNNTPLESRDVTPPKSPVPEEIEEEDEDEDELKSSSSSVEVVGETPTSEDIPALSEYVQERMATLGVKPDCDVESLSSFSECSDSSSYDSDQDYYIVPIPDCFNPNLPASKSASTSIYVMKDEHEDKTVDELLTASNSVEMTPLIPSVAIQSKDADSQASPIMVTANSQVSQPNMVTTDSQASPRMVTTDSQASPSMVTTDSQASPNMVTTDSQASPTMVTSFSQTGLNFFSGMENASTQAAASVVTMTSTDSQTPLKSSADCQTMSADTSTTDSQTPPMSSADCQTTSADTSNMDCQTVTMATADCQTARIATVDCETATASKTSADCQTAAPAETRDAQLQAEETRMRSTSREDDEEDDDDDDEEDDHRFEDAQGDVSDEDNSEETVAKLAGAEGDDEEGLTESQRKLKANSNSIVSAAIVAASQAAANAFSTAKDVFHTLQYVPPQSTWSPSGSQWTPRQNNDDEAWIPQQWTPPTEEDRDTEEEQQQQQPEDQIRPTPREGDSAEMQQLLEMGFGNRSLNQELLTKYGNKLDEVVQELVFRQDSQWHVSRH